MVTTLFPFAGSTPQTPTNKPKLVFEAINLLEDFSIGTAPTFTIVSLEKYVNEILSNSTAARATLLPPTFMLTLAFRPDNNTALKLVSSMSVLHNDDNPLLAPDIVTNSSQPIQNPTDEFAALLLSTAATYLHRDRFYTLWEDVSSSARHSLVFMVTNGSISTCLDGDFRPANPGVVLWEEFSLGQSNEQQMVQFSSYLHSMNSLVNGVGVCVVCVV